MTEQGRTHETFLSLSHFIIHKFNFFMSHVSDQTKGAAFNYLGFLVKGEADFIAEDFTVSIKSGDVIYVPLGIKYKSIWRAYGDIEFYTIEFLFESRSNYEWDSATGRTLPGDFWNLTLQKVFHSEDENTVNYFRNIYDNYYSNKDNCFAAISSFFGLLGKINDRLVRGESPRRFNPVKKAIEYIDKNYSKDFNVAHLAKLCNLSESRFYSVFKHYTGYTPVGYKNKIKIIHSIKLLSDINNTVELISESMNFSSPAYYRKVFKKVTGSNIKDYRPGM